MKKLIKILFLSNLLLSVCCKEKIHETHVNEFDLNGETLNSTYAVSNSKSCLTNYFSNLTSNFGNNFSQSSCGYVALGMLLTYYDSMVNANIVESSYDVNSNYSTKTLSRSSCESPGSAYDWNVTFSNTQEYWNYLNSTKNVNLHAKLAVIGTTYLNRTSNLENLSYMDVFGTNYEVICYTINNYLESLNYSFDYTISYKAYDRENLAYGNSNSYEDVFQFIYSEISLGRPVIIGFDGHARIAYDSQFTLANDYKIYLHEGYRDSFRTRLTTNSLMNLETLNNPLYSGKTYLSAISLQLDDNTPVTPGYNYHSIYYNDDNTYFGEFTNHNTHIYDFNCRPATSNYHNNYCKCGLYVQELHEYRKNFNFSEPYCKCGEENPFYFGGGILKKEEELSEE